MHKPSHGKARRQQKKGFIESREGRRGACLRLPAHGRRMTHWSVDDAAADAAAAVAMEAAAASCSASLSPPALLLRASSGFSSLTGVLDGETRMGRVP